MRRGRLWVLIVVIVLVIVSLACGDSTPTAAPPEEPAAEEATEAPAAEEPPAEEEAEPTEVAPTEIPPTEEPEPTEIPESTAEPEPPAEPFTIPLAGTGPDIIDVETGCLPSLIVISGNQGAAHFAVTSYDADNEMIDLLINTTESYRGTRPLNFTEDQCAARFEIKAEGDWAMEIIPILGNNIPLLEPYMLRIPGDFAGENDYVLMLMDGEPDTADITGNAAAHHFAVMGHGDVFFPDLLVNTTEPYEGTVMLRQGVNILEIKAEGPWTVKVAVK